ncbi:MFS transporter [Cryobacterium sp. Y50]|uniref:MFS transporter n=1 Tax=Cryobacterium sp. Y50 TaxID=2048286 RepID=UPI001304AB0A|nr:MFS transporter [Cryobacterium sp. Y50]
MEKKVVTKLSEGGSRLTKSVAIVSFVVVALSYTLNAMDRQVFPVLLPSIREDLGYSLAQGGLVATIFTLGIGLAGVPTGFLLDKLSRKAVMLLGIFIYSLFTLLTTFSVGFFDMLAFRAVTGVGEAMQNAALFSAVGAYFFANRALAIGGLNFAFGLGGFLGPLLGAKMAASSGWQLPFYVYGVLGFVFIALIAVFIKKKFTEQVEGAAEQQQQATFNHVPDRLLNRNVVMLGITAGVVGLAMYGFIGLYPTFLQTDLGFTLPQAGTAASMFGLGAMMGLPAGYLSDKLNQRYVLMSALVIGSLVGYLIFNGPTSTGWQYFLSFAEGAVASGFCFVGIYAALQRSVRPQIIGRASGIFISSFYIPASVAGYVFSALVGLAGWGGAGFWQLSVLPLLGIVALLFVDTSKFSNARLPLNH